MRSRKRSIKGENICKDEEASDSSRKLVQRCGSCHSCSIPQCGQCRSCKNAGNCQAQQLISSQKSKEKGTRADVIIIECNSLTKRANSLTIFHQQLFSSQRSKEKGTRADVIIIEYNILTDRAIASLFSTNNFSQVKDHRKKGPELTL